jgi:hypothetical protein
VGCNFLFPSTHTSPSCSDTEGGFHIHRAHEIAQSMVDQMQARHTTDSSQLPTARSILSNIHLFRIHSHFELIALVINLPNILEAYPKVRIEYPL